MTSHRAFTSLCNFERSDWCISSRTSVLVYIESSGCAARGYGGVLAHAQTRVEAYIDALITLVLFIVESREKVGFKAPVFLFPMVHVASVNVCVVQFYEANNFQIFTRK